MYIVHQVDFTPCTYCYVSLSRAKGLVEEASTSHLLRNQSLRNSWLALQTSSCPKGRMDLDATRRNGLVGVLLWRHLQPSLQLSALSGVAPASSGPGASKSHWLRVSTLDGFAF